MGALKLMLRPDPPDVRDFLFKDHFTIRKDLPPSATNRRRLRLQIEDQEDIGSCGLNAAALMIEDVYRRIGIKFQASRLFMYWNVREAMGMVGEDSGVYLRLVIKMLQKFGVCDESLWPYITKEFKKKPHEICYADALDHQIEGYLKLVELHEMKQCVADGFNLMFGVPLYDSFDSLAVQRTGKVPMPTRHESIIGYHAMSMVGYSDFTKRVTVANSWGLKWGDKGFCTLPYDYMERAEDNWTIKVMEDTRKKLRLVA